MLLRRRPILEDDLIVNSSLPAGATASARIDPITGQAYVKPRGAWKFAAMSFAALLFVLAFRSAWDSPRVYSRLTLEQAAIKSREQNKALVLSFSSKLDADCKRMERESWRDSQLTRSLGERAIVIKLSPDSFSKQEKAATQAFAVTTVPTIILLRDAREIGRLTGYQSAQQIVTWFDSALSSPDPKTPAQVTQIPQPAP